MLHAKGELLTIDVADRTWETATIDDVLETYLGGRGAATKLAHDRIPFDADPLGSENRLYLSTGPMQMSQMSFTGRMNATGLSPLTDGLASSNAGGFLSREFVDTGYSCVEIVGASDDRLAIHVTDDGVEFEPVPVLEGATVRETSAVMEERHDLQSENLVRYASLMTSNSRAFGRGGLGDLLGSKNVKVVSFHGDSRPTVELPDEEVTSDIHQDAATKDHIMKRQGTTSGVDLKNDMFSLPTKYFERMDFDEGVEGINGSAIESKKYKRGTCSLCAFACKLPTKDEETGLETEGPEYETVFSFGSTLLVDDVVSVMKSNELCDELGLDTISAGVSIGAYLMAEDEFGNDDLIHELVEKIAYREGVGDTLAEGVDRIHEELGVTNWTSKRLEFPGHDGRVLHGRALGYATANRGADHMYSKVHNLEYEGRVEPDGLDGKGEIVAELENLKAVQDSAVVCKFAKAHMTDERYEQIFGVDYDSLLATGAQIVELERHFNNQRGFDRADDVLPYEIEGMEQALDEYYRTRGWNDDGTVPEPNVSTHE
jgi:aldehyde:ferredoxin oxidoreductase